MKHPQHPHVPYISHVMVVLLEWDSVIKQEHKGPNDLLPLSQDKHHHLHLHRQTYDRCDKVLLQG